MYISSALPSNWRLIYVFKIAKYFFQNIKILVAFHFDDFIVQIFQLRLILLSNRGEDSIAENGRPLCAETLRLIEHISGLYFSRFELCTLTQLGAKAD